MKAENNKYVAIHYTLTDDEGQVIDKSREDNPLGFVMGKQAILPKLEEQILGKEVGDKLTAVLEPKDGYGEYDKTFVTEVDRKNFETENPIEIGMAFQAMTAMGPLIVRVTKITDDKITVDGNHELAGVRLHFDVELAEVRDATEEELNPPSGCCGGGCGGCGGCGDDCGEEGCGCGDGGCGGSCGCN